MKPEIVRIRRFLKSQIDRNNRLHQAQNRGEGPLEWVARLRTWQAQRLTDSFADLHASERYGRAVRFFISDLYGSTGFEQRDEELERIEPIMVRLLPAHLIETVGRAMELQALSEELDIALARVNRISMQHYVSAVARHGLPAWEFCKISWKMHFVPTGQ